MQPFCCLYSVLLSSNTFSLPLFFCVRAGYKEYRRFLFILVNRENDCTTLNFCHYVLPRACTLKKRIEKVKKVQDLNGTRAPSTIIKLTTVSAWSHGRGQRQRAGYTFIRLFPSTEGAAAGKRDSEN